MRCLQGLAFAATLLYGSCVSVPDNIPRCPAPSSAAVDDLEAVMGERPHLMEWVSDMEAYCSAISEV